MVCLSEGLDPVDSEFLSSLWEDVSLVSLLTRKIYLTVTLCRVDHWRDRRRGPRQGSFDPKYIGFHGCHSART
jgi:hypothetical protein